MFQAGRMCSWFCIAASIAFALLTFPAANGQNEDVFVDDQNITSCSNLTANEADCCNNTNGLTCSLCKDGDDSLACKAECDAGETDTCEAPPAPVTVTPETCANLTIETCCNATALNCSLCHVEGETSDGICKAQCEAEEKDTCQGPGPTTVPTPTTTANSSTTAGTTSGTTSTTPGKGGSSGQSFDGASFVGGIILSLGIVAIVFFGLKFYKARKDQTYHTL